MSGTLVNLTANHGMQDEVIYSDPDVSFFVSVTRRITNFAIEPLRLPTNISSLGGSAYVTIQRSGDLLGEVYVMSKFAGSSTSTDFLVEGAGNALVKEVACEIGGQVIDRHDGYYLDMYEQLHQKPEKTLKEMCGYLEATDAKQWLNKSSGYLYTPLRFWFCNSPSLYLPLISLQFHDVKISLNTADPATILQNGASMSSMDLLCNYVYLDENERKRMAREQHEYLIPTVQSLSQTDNKSQPKLDLPFNHPVKDLMWSVQDTTILTNNADIPFDYSLQNAGATVGYGDTVDTAQLRLNHHNRFGRDAMPGSYFRLVVPYERFAAMPNKNVYAYSFGLDASHKTQPTGTCNFSRIDNAVLDLKLNQTTNQLQNYTVRVYAESWNVLRIFSGMGGLAYSN